MIKINLLATEKPRAAGKSRIAKFNLKGQQVAFGCALILVGSAGTIGWRYQMIQKESAQLDADITAAQEETVRLRSVIVEVQQFEQRRTQLQQRVSLIEELRKDQGGPVRMLDQISLALPTMMWLTEVKQAPGTPEVVVDGRTTANTTLSDFVASLEASGYFKRSVEIVSSQAETNALGDLVKFSLKAQFQQPGAASSATTASSTTAAKPTPAAKPTT